MTILNEQKYYKLHTMKLIINYNPSTTEYDVIYNESIIFLTKTYQQQTQW